MTQSPPMQPFAGRATMDFFAHQEHARRKTGQLVVLFVLAVIMILAAVNVAAFGIMRIAEQSRQSRRFYRDDAALTVPMSRRPEPYIATTLGTLAIIISGSL